MVPVAVCLGLTTPNNVPQALRELRRVDDQRLATLCEIKGIPYRVEHKEEARTALAALLANSVPDDRDEAMVEEVAEGGTSGWPAADDAFTAALSALHTRAQLLLQLSAARDEAREAIVLRAALDFLTSNKVTTVRVAYRR